MWFTIFKQWVFIFTAEDSKWSLRLVDMAAAAIYTGDYVHLSWVCLIDMFEHKM